MSPRILIRLEGEFNVAVAGELEFTLREADSALDVILDFSQTTHLDASALDYFVELYRRRSGPRPIYVMGVRPHLRRLFTSTGLEKLFDFSMVHAAESMLSMANSNA